MSDANLKKGLLSWNDKETLLQSVMGDGIICADRELFLGERAVIGGGNFVNEIMVKNISIDSQLVTVH